MPPCGVPFPVALLGLGSINGMGQKALEALVRRYGDDLGTVFKEPDLAGVLTDAGISGAEKLAAAVTREPDLLVRRGEAEVKGLENRNIRVVPPSRLPDRLRSINGESPKWLCVEGSSAVLTNRPVVAVVGTRNPSQQGLEAARVVATVLSAYKVTLVSGLAEGIDCEAHHQSLNRGVTNVAFLGHGINLVFPQNTAYLRQIILDRGGAVVSEYHPDQHYQKRLFVERNRLQAAMADIVVPVEAASASGTAHTIRFARRYARTLVGLTWPGANGIVDDLRANNDRIIDIFTSPGQKELDRLFKELLTEQHGDTYPFRSIERFAAREFCNRNYTDADVNQLVKALRRAAKPRKPAEKKKPATKRKPKEPPPNAPT